MVVFIDLDGVLVDFIGGCAKEFNKKIPDPWPNREYDPTKLWDMNPSRFWGSLDSDFWANLSKTDYCDDVVTLVQKFTSNWCILTSPTLSPLCAAGKMRWISSNLKAFYRMQRFLIGPAKHLCASPTKILIDDCEDHVDLFRAHGGKAILFPQLWNSNDYLIGNRIGYLNACLENYNAWNTV